MTEIEQPVFDLFFNILFLAKVTLAAFSYESATLSNLKHVLVPFVSSEEALHLEDLVLAITVPIVHMINCSGESLGHLGDNRLSSDFCQLLLSQLINPLLLALARI
jgi:hypothetical protein